MAVTKEQLATKLAEVEQKCAAKAEAMAEFAAAEAALATANHACKQAMDEYTQMHMTFMAALEQ